MNDPLMSNEKLFQKAIEDEARRGCVTMTSLAVWLFPAFSLLDYFTHHEKFAQLSVIRFGTSFVFAVLYIIFKKGNGLRKPILSGSLLLAFASLSITLMCLILDGSRSPYYAGVNLVSLAGVLILPTTARQMTAIISLIIGIYLVGIFGKEGFPDHPQDFVNNLYFLVSTGVIGVTASYFKDHLRRESFSRYLAISRSVEVLKNDLQSGHENIEGLAHQMVSKKTEALNALELRDGFISMASHELRSPLTAMKLQLELGLKRLEEEPNEVLTKTLQTSKSQLSRVLRIVDEMLDVARIQSGKFIIEKEICDLRELVYGIMDRYFAQEVSGGKIEFSVSSEPIQGHWDPFKLEQVILNLVNNALRYGNNSLITVALETQGPHATFSVEDRGMGISAEDQKKIFEKFERAQAGIKPGGLGLGLYICKEIVEAHRGTIGVTSAPGMGSRFFFMLPMY